MREAKTGWLAGHSLLHQRQWKEAAKVFESFSNDEPLMSRMWAATAYKRDGQFARAATLAKSVAQADPLLLDAHYLLADIYRQSGDEQEERLAVASLFMLEKIGRKDTEPG